MTNNNGNSNRLDRIENALDRLIDGLTETKAIANSNYTASINYLQIVINSRLIFPRFYKLHFKL